MKKYLLKITLLIFIMCTTTLPVCAQNQIDTVKAKVIVDNGTEEVKQENEPIQKVQNVTIRILEGEYESEEYELVYVISEDTQDIISNIELREEDNIRVTIEEKDGEISNINYIETINRNYYLYILLVVLILLILIVGKTKAIKPIIIYLISIVLLSYILLISMKKSWNLILISSMISLLITIFVFSRVNGINKKTILMILLSIFGTILSCIAAFVLFDIMNLTNVNIRITENFINIKRLFCSASILIGSVISNVIILSEIYLSSTMNRSYKTKSDNIIDGQRSLKL